MRCLIVPDSLREAINAKLDAAIAECPDAAADRDRLYSDLVYYFDENGYLPNFSLAKPERDYAADQLIAADNRKRGIE